MRVATVLLNWNSWRDTVACLRSLESLDCAQTPLVIDNGSTNDSVDRIRESCPGVEIVALGANLGFGAGCNAGIRRALAMGAEFIWLLNNDTVVEPGSLGALVGRMKSDSGIGAAGSVICEMDAPERVQVWGGARIRMLLGETQRNTKPVPAAELHCISGASCLLRAEAVYSAGLFDEGFFMYWEDADLGFRLRRAGWKLAVAEDSRILHKGCASLGRRSATLDVWNNRSAARFFRRYSGFPALPLIIGGAYRIARRLALGDFRRAAAVVRGLGEGVSQDMAEVRTMEGLGESGAEFAARESR
jgi:GT2 family glycosyltransferase